MPRIQNKFRRHLPDPETEILILGIFSADVPGSPDFFYGRDRNFLWHLLPICWGLPSLKDSPLEEKKRFMASHKIDFADLIFSVDIPDGEPLNADESFIDGHVEEWNDCSRLIDSLPALKAVYFTRKTFNGIPNTRRQVNGMADLCRRKNIRMCKLDTPSKFFSVEKQQQWVDTIIRQKTCLKP